MTRKIAVVGAGFAGLSACWHLLQQGGFYVDLFDSLGIGGGASGISTGLLHPFPGRLALRSWLSKEGMEASLQLIEVAETSLGRSVAFRTGVLRVALQPMQCKAFQERALEDAEVIWIENVQQMMPGAIQAPGLWIPSAVTVCSKLYLEGLWKACEEKGARLKKMRIKSLEELVGYNAIVVAAGNKTIQFAECAHFDMQLVKGQALLCKTGEELPCSLIGVGGHISPTEIKGVYQVGSTYEHGYIDEEVDPKIDSELLAKAARFYPAAATFEILERGAAVRIAPKKGYRPIAIQIAPKAWALTGLGSRGLLYHALFGAKLADAVLSRRL